MAKKIRLTRKQLKQDEVRSYWNQLLEWMEQNSKTLAIAIAAVAVAAIIGLIVRQRIGSRQVEVSRLLADGQIDMARAMAAEKVQDRDKLYLSAEEKLRTIIDMYGRSKLAPEARFLLGNIAFFRNDYEEAARFYQEYIDNADDDLEKAEGYIALGYTYENQFFWTTRQEGENRALLNQALQSYLEAESLTSGTMQRYLAMLGRARIYDLHENQAEQAKALYRRIAQERRLPAPDLSDEARRSRYGWLLEQMATEDRLFTLAETAQIRLDRLEAED